MNTRTALVNLHPYQSTANLGKSLVRAGFNLCTISNRDFDRSLKTFWNSIDFLFIRIDRFDATFFQAVQKIQKHKIRTIVLVDVADKKITDNFIRLDIQVCVIKAGDNSYLEDLLNSVYTSYILSYSHTTHGLNSVPHASESGKYVIERAKKLLMDRHMFNEEEALQIIQEMAANRSQKLFKVAEYIINTDNFL